MARRRFVDRAVFRRLGLAGHRGFVKVQEPRILPATPFDTYVCARRFGPRRRHRARCRRAGRGQDKQNPRADHVVGAAARTLARFKINPKMRRPPSYLRLGGIEPDETRVFAPRIATDHSTRCATVRCNTPDVVMLPLTGAGLLHAMRDASHDRPSDASSLNVPCAIFGRIGALLGAVEIFLPLRPAARS